MLSEQEQRRRDEVEAEIRQVARLVEANAEPKRLSMEWNQAASSEEFTIRLTFFTRSYVVCDRKVIVYSPHNLRISIPRSYPYVTRLHVKVDSYPLYHPNFPLSRDYESRRNLEDTVLWLWDLFTFRYMDPRLASNQRALSWLESHPGYRQQLGTETGLRLPSVPRHVADEQFKVKDKRGSGMNIKVKNSRSSDYDARSGPDAERRNDSQGVPAVSEAGERAYAMSRSISRSQAEERVSASPPVVPVPVQGFLNKGLRVYQPQQLAFPELLNKRDEWTRSPDGWQYRVPTHGYTPSRLKVVFLQSALTKIFHHATEISNVERFGILIGGVFYDAERAENWVQIVDMLPAERVHANVASVEVSHEEIARLNAKVDRILADTGDIIRKIGWYHTHPGHGIFMSSTDQTNQKYCYTADWQVALVVDPLNRHYGAFSGPDCYALTNGVLVISDGHAAQLNTPAFEAWQKIAPRTPDVLTSTVNLGSPQEPTPADTRVPPPAPARGIPSTDTTPDPPRDSQPGAHKLIIRHDVNGQVVSGTGNEPVSQLPIGGQALIRHLNVQLNRGRRNWRSVAVIVIFLFLVLLVLVAYIMALTRLDGETTQLHALATQVAPMRQQLSHTKQQLSSMQQNAAQTQKSLLEQAKNVKDPLTHRKLLELVVRIDRTSASGKTAIQLLSKPVSYTVVANDTFNAIAQRFGVSPNALQNANPKVDPKQIYPGQVLIIPGEQVSDS
ncbi:hypothetical protein KSF_038810 [Reticulibacter mediterranei]|uniref:MPN domain-containing protein n=1 Tax=Reticulibacter mediterranei TaxID=2778369 RepID=A0A8J3N2Z7_9CHLR|nr:LysM peptidoglycan-binding domain-containing protein [Reticulibacter mediterranei]GHO93833.1 hypothetical protein KSF_038810 [Reticulibacter mediterranei]